MVQNKLPLINSEHGSETRNIINELIKLFNGMGYTYDEALQNAHNVLSEAKKTNNMNKDVQAQVNKFISEFESTGETNLEIVQARGGNSVLDDRFEDIEEKRRDYAFGVNSVQPPKQGANENSYKIVRKISNDALEIFQKTNNGYLRYLYEKGRGGSGYGVNYDALRIVHASHISDAIVFSHLDSPSEGSAPRTWDPEERLYIHTSILTYTEENNRDIDTVYHSDHPLIPHTVSPNSSVTYPIRKPINGKCNIMFFFRQAGSQNGDTANIYVNNRLATTVTVDDSFNQSVKVFSIPVPSNATGNARFLNIKIENTSNNEMYPVGLNVFKLSDYEGGSYDSFMCVGSSLPNFIQNNGASDYAMKNAENGLQFGSFHGGEVANSCLIGWRHINLFHESLTPFAKIAVGDFRVVKSFVIKQQTTLIERAYMNSKQSFDNDGTVQMDFSYSVINGKQNVPFIDFWTCLTCTSPDFSVLRQPVLMNNADVPNGHKYFKSTQGFVIQETPNGKQELHSRFSRFTNEFVGVKEPSSISVQSIYHKHYYAPIREYHNSARPIAPEVMQFSKGLDFYVY